VLILAWLLKLLKEFARAFLKTKYKTSEYYRAIRQSFLVSADMAHGVHPNYSEKHQPLHAPKIHQGIVSKINANQRYMTDTVSASILRAIAERAEVPFTRLYC